MDNLVDPSAVLEEARELIEQGQHAEALQRHLWFHQHALEHRPALYGVRLSFALADWYQLGQDYPPALQALREIRDAKEADLATGGGSGELFHDVAAINRRFGELAKTVELFRLLDAARPGFAADCYRMAEDSIATLGEYDLGARYIPDPQARFDTIRQRREELVRFHAESTGPDDAAILRVPERIFAREVGHVVQILHGAGRIEEAERMRALALATSDCPEVREALGLPPAEG